MDSTLIRQYILLKYLHSYIPALLSSTPTVKKSCAHHFPRPTHALPLVKAQKNVYGLCGQTVVWQSPEVLSEKSRASKLPPSPGSLSHVLELKDFGAVPRMSAASPNVALGNPPGSTRAP